MDVPFLQNEQVQDAYENSYLETKRSFFSHLFIVFFCRFDSEKLITILILLFFSKLETGNLLTCIYVNIVFLIMRTILKYYEMYMSYSNPSSLDTNLSYYAVYFSLSLYFIYEQMK